MNNMLFVRVRDIIFPENFRSYQYEDYCNTIDRFNEFRKFLHVQVCRYFRAVWLALGSIAHLQIEEEFGLLAERNFIELSDVLVRFYESVSVAATRHGQLVEDNNPEHLHPIDWYSIKLQVLIEALTRRELLVFSRVLLELKPHEVYKLSTFLLDQLSSTCLSHFGFTADNLKSDQETLTGPLRGLFDRLFHKFYDFLYHPHQFRLAGSRLTRADIAALCRLDLECCVIFPDSQEFVDDRLFKDVKSLLERECREDLEWSDGVGGGGVGELVTTPGRRDRDLEAVLTQKKAMVPISNEAEIDVPAIAKSMSEIQITDGIIPSGI